METSSSSVTREALETAANLLHVPSVAREADSAVFWRGAGEVMPNGSLGVSRFGMTRAPRVSVKPGGPACLYREWVGDAASDRVPEARLAARVRPSPSWG